MMIPTVRRVLVTGGAGFIGRRVVDRLCALGVQVTVVDNLCTGVSMPPQSPGLSTRLLDIRDADALARAFDEAAPEAVMNLAAIHHIPTCERERAYALDVNIVGAERVLEECERRSVAVTVLASSGAVYAPVEGALSEDATPLEAIDNYSLCKIANEQQARLWSERTSGVVRVARIFNTIGHDDPHGHLIPEVLEQIVGQGGSVSVKLGAMTSRRDYIHADDTADGLVALLTQGEVKAPFETFNIASGREYAVGEIIEAIADQMGVRVTCASDPSRLRRVDRPSLLASVIKIEERTGWAARHALRGAIRKTLQCRKVIP